MSGGYFHPADQGAFRVEEPFKVLVGDCEPGGAHRVGSDFVGVIGEGQAALIDQEISIHNELAVFEPEPGLGEVLIGGKLAGLAEILLGQPGQGGVGIGENNLVESQEATGFEIEIPVLNLRIWMSAAGEFEQDEFEAEDATAVGDDIESDIFDPGQAVVGEVIQEFVVVEKEAGDDVLDELDVGGVGLLPQKQELDFRVDRFGDIGTGAAGNFRELVRNPGAGGGAVAAMTGGVGQLAHDVFGRAGGLAGSAFAAAAPEDQGGCKNDQNTGRDQSHP